MPEIRRAFFFFLYPMPLHRSRIDLCVYSDIWLYFVLFELQDSLRCADYKHSDAKLSKVTLESNLRAWSTDFLIYNIFISSTKIISKRRLSAITHFWVNVQKCLNFLVFKNHFIESLQIIPTYSWEAYVKIATQKQMKVWSVSRVKRHQESVNLEDYFEWDKWEKLIMSA